MQPLRLKTISYVLATAVLLTAANAASAETVRSGFIEIETSQIGKPPTGTTPVQSLIEYLGNPGFETGSLPPWTTNNWVVTDTDAHSGTYSAYDVGNYWVRQDFPPIDTADVLSVTYWMRQPESAISAYDFFYDDNTYDEDIVFPGPNWSQFNITSALRPPGSILVAIRLWGYSGGGPNPDETYLDDVALQVAGVTDIQPATWGEIKSLFE